MEIKMNLKRKEFKSIMSKIYDILVEKDVENIEFEIKTKEEKKKITYETRLSSDYIVSSQNDS
ncbi:hypothetical protein X275_01285 [Marinitoga sp. 1197]|uniref:hypothetical protein n=1 Tax=Marinitoga sp. 1197 TaxID=1428449 RepID=UPI00064164C2|nr:hypothetical protein [Marinitoga sp. 1197]AJW76904.1 hypothetical protein UF08_15 [Marinitoga camini virus 1]KLO24051.1 hypothetical protein X275_01285 [Marinitoga sp. 1197]